LFDPELDFFLDGVFAITIEVHLRRLYLVVHQGDNHYFADCFWFLGEGNLKQTLIANRLLGRARGGTLYIFGFEQGLSFSGAV